MSLTTMNMMKDNMLCPECNGTVYHKDIESYCTKCGLVVDDSPMDDDDSTIDNDGNVISRRTGPPLKMWDRVTSLI